MTPDVRLYTGDDLAEVELLEVCGGQVAVFTTRSPESEGLNEDSALVATLGPDRAVLAVADGMGGRARGEVASRTVLETLRDVLIARREEQDIRAGILQAIDDANQQLLQRGTGAGSTLSLVELEGRTARSYHVGDSIVLITGQRGRRKHETVPHSPVGYAVEAGLLHENEAMLHDERHLVSAFLGERQTRISMSAQIPLSARDSVLVATDGLADNLRPEEVIDIIRKGPLAPAADHLRRAAASRMNSPGGSEPSKTDDLTFLLYRPGPAVTAK